MFGFVCRGFHSSVRNQAKNHYERLKIPHDASISEIKNKFKKISLKLHPDILKSQGLSDDELSLKSDEYLKVKKSYEILSDSDKRNEYDLHLGIRRREGSSTDSFFKRPGNTFHFHEKYRYNDVPHFDTKKHQERNERIEKRYKYNQKMNQTVDQFGRDLYSRNLGNSGPRKDIYREYKYQPNIHDDESEGKKIAIKVVTGVIGIFVMWYLICGNFTTEVSENKKTKPAIPKDVNDKGKDEGELEKMDKTVEDGGSDTEIGGKNQTSRSGSKMNVNNSYGMMLIKGKERDDSLEQSKADDSSS